MAQAQQQPQQPSGVTLAPSPQPAPVSSRPNSWAWFCGVLIGVAGLFHLFDGLVGLYNAHYYTSVAAANGVTLPVTYTLRTWSWVAIGLGGAMIIVAVGVVSGYMWARVLGVIAAGLSMVYQFGFLPAYPWWGLMIIALDVIVIYGIVVHVRRIEPSETATLR